MSSYYSAKQKYRRDRENRAGDDFKNEEFQYKYDAVEDSSFHLVDTAKAKTSRFNQGFKKPWQTRGRGRGAWGKGGRGQGQQDQFGKGGKGGRGNQQAKGGKNGKGGAAAAGGAGTACSAWTAAAASRSRRTGTYDRLSTRADKPLQRCENREFYYVTTTDDPAIEKLAEEQAGTVYGTDAIFSLLMASPRSVYPWDVIVQKLDGTLVFDKRDTAAFDFLTVSETSHEPPVAPNPDQEDDKDKKPADEINTPEKLSIEATMINQNFSQQILKTDPAPEKMALPNPFADAESESKPASMAYRYRKFALGEHTIVARTELHGLVEKRGEKHKMTAYCLNEWDSKLSGGVEWRQKIDSQRGAVLATELKNNSCKLARWTAQSILAGAEQMKLGYVSRVARTNPYDHVVLATQFYKPREFATQITLNVNNMWGIIKMLVDLLLSYDDGKYVIARDGAKPIVRIYAVPNSTFDDESDEDDVELQNENDSDESD
ncbi:hypothetical protein JL721_2060 [Aureococcus anophagefferens]|nr:hypothetical protein JL721_2060 [Aureococcus anophagefferens]